MCLLLLLQELRWRRDQLANELQLRQQQLQRLEGRHHELEMQLEMQRQQLINELQVLAQLQQQQAQQAAQQAAQQQAPEAQVQRPQQQPKQEQQQQQHEAPQHLQHSQQVERPQQELHRGQHSSQCAQQEHQDSLAGLQQSSDTQHPPLCRPEAAPSPGMAEDSARPLHVQQQVAASTMGNSSGTSHNRDTDRDGDAGGSSAAAGLSHQQHCAATVHRAAEQAPLDGGVGSSSGGMGPSLQTQAVPQAGPEQQQQQQPPLGLRWRFRRRA